MTLTPSKWLPIACLTGSALLLTTLIFSPVRGEGTDTPVSGIQPVASQPDPGPTTFIGAETTPGGTQFIWADVYIDGPGSYRVYFDCRDKANFHYLDRDGAKVVIGLYEAGIEQRLASAQLTETTPLRLARHGGHIGLFQSGKLVMSAFDDRLLGGAIGWRMLSKDDPVTLKTEARDDIHFADDFMINEKKAAQWSGNGSHEKGDFAVKSLRHPLLSANAFNFLGYGKNIYSVAGQPWWDHYRYNVSMRGPAGQSIGLVFAYQDEKNYGLFRWSARKPKSDDKEEVKGTRELVCVRNGTETVLVKAQGGYAPDQWYNAEINMTYSSVTVSIDGHQLMEASDPALACGGAGVWCDVALPATLAADPKAQSFQINSLNELMKQHAAFDDVRINSLDGVNDDFTRPGPLSGGWLVGTGTWSVEKMPNEYAGSVRVIPGATAAKALIGDRRWRQYEIEADVVSSTGAAGIVFLHRDESNYLYATLDGGMLRLMRVADGQESIADSCRLPKIDGTVRLKATAKHGHIRVSARATDPASAESVSVETFDGETALKGRAGLIAAGGRSGERSSIFKRFHLSFLPEPEPLVTTNAIFEGEMTMNDWTNPTSEWYPPKDQMLVDGKAVNLLWHRSQFPGDVELSLEPREISEPKFELALSVAKDGQGKNNGYVFRYKAGDAGEGPSRATTLQLMRQGEKVMEKVLNEDVRQLSSVAVRHCGKYVVGLVNGKPLLAYRDDKPLEGSRVAFYTQGLTVKTEAIKIISDHFHNDLFSTAASNWRTAGAAIAEVTNRWQCDPRWSFFSLKNDRRAGKPAVLWSKNLYPGDVTVEFYVANKMEGERGAPYTYARDINVTICSDGSDLSKGYTCMFGGQNNAGSMILRDGVEVRRSGKPIPTDMNFHRHWFSVKVEKRGNTVSFRVDRYFVSDATKSGELIYEDTQPITGDRLAIWTYDHAIMISRVRISGEGGNVSEHPDWQPEPLKTPYDNR